MEALNFTAFVIMALATHWFAEWYHEHHHAAHPRIAGAVHKLVPTVAVVVSQPHFWMGVKEYLVHLVVYSGYILPPH